MVKVVVWSLFTFSSTAEFAFGEQTTLDNASSLLTVIHHRSFTSSKCSVDYPWYVEKLSGVDMID